MRDHGGQTREILDALGWQHIPIRADFSAALNPLGTPPQLLQAQCAWSELVRAYPEPDGQKAVAALADAHYQNPSGVVLGNGSTELFGLALLALGIRRTVTRSPCWSGYAEASAFAGIPCETSSNIILPGDAVFLASPNNPDGKTLDPEQVLFLCKRHPEAYFFLDLAFDDFLHSPDQSPWWCRAWPRNLIRVKSLTKFFCIPGLRLGFLAAHSEIASKIRTRSLPWRVNALAQWVAPLLYADHDWMTRSRTEIRHRTQRLAEILASGRWQTKICPAWVLAWPPDEDSASWQKRLLGQGVGTRYIQSLNALRWGTPTEESLRVLQEILPPENSIAVSIPSRPPSLFIAGTTSDAGKSVIAAGFCALWKRLGMRPLPFKAQNMSNHAWVTRDGGEIGWAQAIQAFAAGAEPHVDMNPILLKPGRSGYSHVIHCGTDQGVLSVTEYHQSFDQHRTVALAALERLMLRARSLILEGAGGIAEINLRHRDLSNREAPRHAESQIILVGDIDRGGVFASLYGSFACLESDLRSRLKGFVINRLRGDPALLQSGIEELEARTGIPVLGVVPWDDSLSLLGHEDSLGLREDPLPPADTLRVGVIRLPHISNINDWSSLSARPGVSVFLSSDPSKLNEADALILPGTRTTIADLRWLKRQKLPSLLRRWIVCQKPLLAVCGGMQMLGEEICDPCGVESEKPDRENGLGILPMRTTLQDRGKIVSQRHTVLPEFIAQHFPWLRDIREIRGYEIHCGQSSWLSVPPAGAYTWLDGVISSGGSLWATYWHGILLQSDLCEAWLRFCAQNARKALPPFSPEGDTCAIPAHILSGIQAAEALVTRYIRWQELIR